MNGLVSAYIASYPDEIRELYRQLRQAVLDSTSCEVEEKLWARLPSYYAGKRFVRLIPFKDHINVEAQAVSQYRDQLTGCRMTPKGMVQISLKQDIPWETLKRVFSETLGEP